VFAYIVEGRRTPFAEEQLLLTREEGACAPNSLPYGYLEEEKFF